MADIVPPTPDPRTVHAETCLTCGPPRYCAPARCYCGHDDCPAFETYTDPWAQPYREVQTKTNAQAKSWANREGATWIDSL